MITAVKTSLLLLPLFCLLGCDAGPMVYSDTDESLDHPKTETIYEKSLRHVISRDTLILNPSGYTPLVAELQMETSQPVQVELEIESPNEEEENLIHRFEEVGTSFTLPVLGLYASHRNTLHIRFYDSGKQLLGGETRTIDTPELIKELPVINVRLNTVRKKPGMNLVSYQGHTNRNLPQIPFIFDQYGHIRWYANMDGHPVLRNLFYSISIERLKNGNLYFGDSRSSRLVEMDMLGRVINEWPLLGYYFRSTVLELPNGNLLATATKNGLPTIADHVLEVDRETGTIVQVWDLRQSLDSRRRIFSSSSRDWFHVNGLSYDEEKDAIIVSGRVQGTVKLTRDNELIWILAPHRGWKQSGNGADLKTKLLQPLDANGVPITDLRVIAGFSDHPDFSWAWGQHAPKWTSRGTLFLFDNGDRRHYHGRPVFSRAVQYHIDEEAMTIQQVWEYGRERGHETYSPYVSDVDYHQDENTVFFMPGGNYEYGVNGKTIEVDYTTKDVVYEATVRNDQFPEIMFHRIERLPIYPHNR